jgi:hypothetical protein
MKQKDIAMIAVIAIISGVASLFISQAVFSGKASRSQTAEVVDSITADFPTPSAKYFNAESIDPTQMIKIGDNNNATPFKEKAQ